MIVSLNELHADVPAENLKDFPRPILLRLGDGVVKQVLLWIDPVDRFEVIKLCWDWRRGDRCGPFRRIVGFSV
ncbi:MAG: hypothetical protein ACK5F7_03260, partial [Planctomycetaceae bacterium]